ncbi:MAG: SRPBCC family protein [Actinomycetota bacterium]
MSHDLRLERLFDASAEEVFDAFTDPDAQKEWYEDNPRWVVHAECDLRAGGVWDVSFGEPGTVYRETNIFSEVDRPHRLAYVSTFTKPDASSFDTTLVVTFEERGGKTLMTIVQRGFPDAQERDEHQAGWPGFIDRLERVVAARTAT